MNQDGANIATEPRCDIDALIGYDRADGGVFDWSANRHRYDGEIPGLRNRLWLNAVIAVAGN
jgi:hypothetical protein